MAKLRLPESMKVLVQILLMGLSSFDLGISLNFKWERKIKTFQAGSAGKSNLDFANIKSRSLSREFGWALASRKDKRFRAGIFDLVQEFLSKNN